jgi:uncharacterized membrane protein (DUF2068 family)
MSDGLTWAEWLALVIAAVFFLLPLEIWKSLTKGKK